MKKANLRLMAVVIMVVLIGAGLSHADLTDGLVAHWKLDEGSGNMAYDAIGGNDGIIFGAQRVEGLSGGALSFDGNDDYISILENTLPDTGPYSISLWLYTGGNYQGQYVWGGHDQNACWIHYYINDNARYTVGSKNRGSGRVVIRSANNQTFENYRPLNDQWVHVVVVFDSDGKAVKLYRDAFDSPNYYNIYSGYTETGWGFSGTETVIGRQGSGSAYYYGLMDDIRIYNKALSESEVQQLYRGQLVDLEIVGPDIVTEDLQTQYKAIAHYDNNSTSDVTGSVQWSIEPNDIASIAAGLLTTEMVDLTEDITITAQYGEGPNAVEDEKQVSVLPICPSGSALEFDGVDDWVDLTDFNLGENFSVALWVNPSRTDGGRCFIGKHTLGGLNIFVIGIWENGYHARIRDDWYTSGTPTTGWQHIAVVVEQLSPSTSNVTIYKNGEVLWKQTLNEVVGDMSGLPWTIGQDWDHRGPDKTDFFNGLIDEVVIFNMALSAEDIQGLMHTSPDVNNLNLISYWDFDEGSGQVATDLAGDNDGQLGDTNTPDNGDPNWVDSDAPIGICAMAELFERNINQAINLKLEMLDMLEEALGKEAVGEYILEQLLNDADSSVWKKRDILESKRMVRSAVQNEGKAEIDIEQSIDKLDDAMDTLGIE